MAEPRWLSSEEQSMWRALQEMQRRLFRAVERDLVDTSGLSSADFAVLVPLSEAPERRLRARDLGQLLDWDRSRLSHQIRRMEKRKLVGRSNCPTDARGTVIDLTDAGWDAIEQAAPGHVDTVRRSLFDVLSVADVSALRDIAGRVNEHLATTDCSTSTESAEEPCDA